MEENTCPRRVDREGLLSCWGRLKLKLPWINRRLRSANIKKRKFGGRFRYDPLSYAQNFDEGWDDATEEVTQRGFSARYAAPPPKSHGDK
ncbi:hypothetical protein CJ030_MR0G007416 [Morella rubra]|uniref:Uncharacterized protein n=1 Tax=Morella rubra TaxID=262757 RepID=A0A6A1UJ26_9ROSI|nr:hypothetical protein CJ030_MR0G007416 [Morella rubra]